MKKHRLQFLVLNGTYLTPDSTTIVTCHYSVKIDICKVVK